MTTIKKSSPNAKNGGLLHFSVEGDESAEGEERISFVRFDLSTISASDVVARATLSLHLVGHHKKSDEEHTFKIDVDALPQGGDWSTGSVSWNDQLECKGSFFVESFSAVPLESSVEKQIYAVDVTSAIVSTKKWITFKLSTESSGRLDFAGKKWSGGEAVPELMLTMSA